MAPNRVLVVEDDVAFEELLAYWLRMLGYEVFVATTLAAAVNHVKTNDDLLCILLDLRLPDTLHDYDALATLVETNPTLPIAVLSGRDDVSATTISQLGARLFLHKSRATATTIQALLTACT